MELLELEKHLKALANKRRIRMLVFLMKKGEVKIDRIAQALKLPYKTVFRNLSILRNAGFVESRILRAEVYFKITKDPNKPARHLLSLIKKIS